MEVVKLDENNKTQVIKKEASPQSAEGNNRIEYDDFSLFNQDNLESEQDVKTRVIDKLRKIFCEYEKAQYQIQLNRIYNKGNGSVAELIDCYASNVQGFGDCGPLAILESRSDDKNCRMKDWRFRDFLSNYIDKKLGNQWLSKIWEILNAEKYGNYEKQFLNQVINEDYKMYNQDKTDAFYSNKKVNELRAEILNAIKKIAEEYSSIINRNEDYKKAKDYMSLPFGAELGEILNYFPLSIKTALNDSVSEHRRYLERQELLNYKFVNSQNKEEIKQFSKDNEPLNDDDLKKLNCEKVRTKQNINAKILFMALSYIERKPIFCLMDSECEKGLFVFDASRIKDRDVKHRCIFNFNDKIDVNNMTTYSQGLIYKYKEQLNNKDNPVFFFRSHPNHHFQYLEPNNLEKRKAFNSDMNRLFFDKYAQHVFDQRVKIVEIVKCQANNISKLKENIEKQKQDIASKEKLLQEQEANIKNKNNELANLRNQLNSKEKDLNTNLEKRKKIQNELEEQKKLLKEKAQKEEEKNVLAQSQWELQNKIKELKENIEKQKQDIASKEKLLQEQEANIKNKNNELANLKNQLNSKEKDLNTNLEKQKKLQNELEEQKKLLEGKTQKIEEEKNGLAQSQEALQNKISEINNKEVQLKQKESELQALQRSCFLIGLRNNLVCITWTSYIAYMIAWLFQSIFRGCQRYIDNFKFIKELNQKINEMLKSNVDQSDCFENLVDGLMSHIEKKSFIEQKSFETSLMSLYISLAGYCPKHNTKSMIDKLKGLQKTNMVSDLNFYIECLQNKASEKIEQNSQDNVIKNKNNGSVDNAKATPFNKNKIILEKLSTNNKGMSSVDKNFC